jgi:hypothetical protein
MRAARAAQNDAVVSVPERASPNLAPGVSPIAGTGAFAIVTIRHFCRAFAVDLVSRIGTRRRLGRTSGGSRLCSDCYRRRPPVPRWLKELEWPDIPGCPR